MTAPPSNVPPRLPTRDKTIMRSLGEFFGHIVKGIRTDPARRRTVVRRETEEQHRGPITLRRTPIDEIEFKSDDATPH